MQQQPPAVFVPRRRRRFCYDPTGVVRQRSDGAKLLFDWVMESPRVFHLTCTEPPVSGAVGLTREQVDPECERLVDSVTSGGDE